MRHWLTRYDPDDGSPQGSLCECPLGKDHTVSDLLDYFYFAGREDDPAAETGEDLH